MANKFISIILTSGTLRMEFCAKIALSIVQIELMSFNADCASGDVLCINFAPLAMPDATTLATLSISLSQDGEKEQEKVMIGGVHVRSINFI